MRLMTLDFESYYSKTYSLTKLTTEAYVNGDEFEVIGVSIKIDDTPTAWYTGDRYYIQGVLDSFDWKNITLVAHNCFFDASILSLAFGIFPARYIDTLSMARAIHGISVGGSLAKLAAYYTLGEKGTEVINALGKHLKDFSQEELDKYGEYCINDTDLTYALLQNLMPHFNTTELALVDITIKMGVVPRLEVDLALLESHLYAVKAAKQDLLDKIIVDKSEIMSNPKLAKLLEEQGAEVPMKVSPTTGKMTYAFAKTDDGLKDLLEHPNVMVQTLVGVRLGVKSNIEETRTERLIDIAKRMGRLPIPLNYYGAATGRWSAGGGQKVNFQNIPRGSIIKEAIVAPEGYLIVGADLSNIELRVGMWVAGEFEALKLLGDGGDLYKDFASKVFNVPYDEVGKEQRFIGKTSCIAEGQLVLTKRGLVPIENILVDDTVWDGVEWVHHDGVVYMGERDVITYQGLTATTDHIVFMGDNSTCKFKDAPQKNTAIAITGNGRQEIQFLGNCKPKYPANQGDDGGRHSCDGVGISTQQTEKLEGDTGKVRVYDILNAGTRHRYTVSGVLVHNCLSLIFGVGAAKLRSAIKAGSGLDLGEVESKRIVDHYRSTYTGVTALWKTCSKAIESIATDKGFTFGTNGLFKVEGNKGVRFPSGLYMQYPQLANVIDPKTGEQGYKYKLRNGYDRLYAGKLTNNCVQGTARCIMSEAMVRINKRYPIVLTIHDALYILAPEHEAQEALDFLMLEMTKAPLWMPDLPLAAEGGFGKSLKDAG